MNPPGQSCGNCRFSLARGNYDILCHRHAPSVLLDEDGKRLTVWPQIAEYYWCGDWEAKGIPKKVLADPVAQD